MICREQRVISYCMLFSISISSSVYSVRCLNEDGAPVDWFVTLKLPPCSSCPGQGAGYLFADDTNPQLRDLGKRLDTLQGSETSAVVVGSLK